MNKKQNLKKASAIKGIIKKLWRVRNGVLTATLPLDLFQASFLMF
jgi:hypothetical protein